jgi:hypothetical protein
MIFICYSRVDSTFLNGLLPRLQKYHGASEVWYDAEILGGQLWWEQILDRIADCHVFLYLLSKDSIDSPYCSAEYHEAKRLQKPILPLQVRARTTIPEELSSIQYVDMSDGTENVD